MTLKIACESEVDHVAIKRDGETAVELVLCDDAVSYESLSPLQLVEYAFEKREISTIPLFPLFKIKQ